MKPLPRALLLLASLIPIGCAEFDGYYDDDNRNNHRMTNWSDRNDAAEMSPMADSRTTGPSNAERK